MTKYKQYFQQMLEANQAVFADFKKVHDLFAADQKTHQAEFNEKGEIIGLQGVVHDVTQTRQLDENLRTEKLKLEQILEFNETISTIRAPE